MLNLILYVGEYVAMKESAHQYDSLITEYCKVLWHCEVLQSTVKHWELQKKAVRQCKLLTSIVKLCKMFSIPNICYSKISVQYASFCKRAKSSANQD